MFTIALDLYRFVQLHLFCGQIAHVPSRSGGIEQKIILAQHTTKTTCCLRIDAGTQTLCIAALSLVYLTAECCAPF